MFEPAVGSGAELFVIIAVGLIGFVVALLHVDIFKEANKKSEDK